MSGPYLSNTFCLSAASSLLHPLQPSTKPAQVIRIPFTPRIRRPLVGCVLHVSVLMRPFHCRCPLRQPTWNQGPTTMCGMNRPSYQPYQQPQYQPYQTFANGGLVGQNNWNQKHGHDHEHQVEQAHFHAEYLFVNLKSVLRRADR